MATLHFDGVDDEVRGTGVGAMNGAMSIALLLQRDTGGSTTPAVFATYIAAGTTEAIELYFTTGDAPDFWNNVASSAASSGTVPKTGTDWFILAITRAAGTVATRYHIRNVTTGAAWVHSNAGAAIAAPASVSGGQAQFGNEGPGSGNYVGDDFNGDIGLVGWWDGTTLSDGQVEELDVNHKTSDWHLNSGGTPSSLTEGNTLTPVDLEGLMTWSTVTATLAGGDPTSWTFDGAGVVDDPWDPPITDAPEVLRVLTTPLRW